jgi:hypothetical protein
MSSNATATVDLKVRDATGQRAHQIRNLDGGTTVGELVDGLVDRLGLSANDANGAAQVFHAFGLREGRHLHASERVGDALQDGDELMLQPDVQAGAPGARPPGLG